MWKLDVEISQYPKDYKLYVKFSDKCVTFENEADGCKLLTFDMSLDELITAGEWAKKFKGAISC